MASSRYSGGAGRTALTGLLAALSLICLYLAALGWEADPKSETAQEVIIPSAFTQVLENYNQLQLEQGFDLTEFRGVRCTVYTYALLSYPSGGCEAQACLYIYRGQVIAGDIHSTAMDGFMHGLQ